MRAAGTVERDERLRLFLALELSDAVTTGLGLWATSHLERGRPSESFHITLAFLGARPRSELDRILSTLRESVDETPPFELEPVGYRETRSVGMLVLRDESGEASRLALALQRRLERLGVYRREARLWLPHITVVRFRERPRLDPPLPPLEHFAPSGAAAFLSRLRPTGARYETLESYPFGA